MVGFRSGAIGMSARVVSVVILYDTEGKILLQHRTKDAPTFPNYWAFFGGSLEEGETPEQAVRRESLEELAYQLRSPLVLVEKNFVHDGSDYTMHVFTEHYDGSPITLGEGQGFAWYFPSETEPLLMNDHDRWVIDHFLGRLRG
jgi:8-oxo-dGTP diphosphatase